MFIISEIIIKVPFLIKLRLRITVKRAYTSNKLDRG